MSGTFEEEYPNFIYYGNGTTQSVDQSQEFILLEFTFDRNVFGGFDVETEYCYSPEG